MEISMKYRGYYYSNIFCYCRYSSNIGLSPIIDAFAVGMAVASTKIIKQVEEFAHKLQLIFATLFFAIIGAQVDLRGINLNVLVMARIIVIIAIFSKLAGCGLPSMLFLKDRKKSMTVGIGMISRGEVGLIVAGIGYHLEYYLHIFIHQ
jgi:Kef-type K+ transport system membrane component KefB